MHQMHYLIQQTSTVNVCFITVHVNTLNANIQSSVLFVFIIVKFTGFIINDVLL